MSMLKKIESKYFKECNVVMLPTKDKTDIRYNSSLKLISKDISDYGEGRISFLYHKNTN